MKKLIKRSESPYIPGYNGLFYFNKALYFSDGESSYGITNIVNKHRPFIKLRSSIQNYTKITLTNAGASQSALDSGVAPDMVTRNSIVIQPRLGFIRLWKEPNGTIYVEFYDTLNNSTVGRPTESIGRAEPYRGMTWTPSLKFETYFYTSDMSQGYATNLFRNYLNRNDFQDGVLNYNGNQLNLQYIDINISWARLAEPGSNPITWIVLDDGYTGRNWISIPEGSTNARWTGSIMAQRFASSYVNMSNHWDNVINNPAVEEVINVIGTTEINLGLGDVKLIIQDSEEGYSLSFSSQNDISAKNIILNCKIISDSGTVRLFNPINNAINNIYFNGNSKLEILASGNFETKQEIFIDDNGKNLILISQQFLV